MLVTEEEAKTKWCSFARTTDPSESAAVNRMAGGRPDPEARCLGSGCMAWRWAAGEAEESLISAIKRYRDETRATLVDAKDYVETHPEYRRSAAPPEKGFCGLAGAPR